MERLILCGGGHVSLEVAHIARRLEFELVVIDDRSEFASPERFPMAARVVHKMGLAEDKQNFLLMHAAGVNVSGQIASVIAGGLILALVGG